MYIKRDTTGSITAASLKSGGETAEFIADDAPELLEFMENKPEPHQSLEDTDQQMARVMEDVIYLLIDKGIVQFTELPTVAQEKLLSRRSDRGKVRGINLLDDEDILG